MSSGICPELENPVFLCIFFEHGYLTYFGT